ncbi:response regulator transcription factor [Aquabacterium sp. OR-4]|uniref:response regulator transcription factor n=1 Tax=Aquabacterium sp. OR-4 TaxID=2978127 RepID=UPI0021B33ED3|nr:response regulator transcription factor [Aquabacterium sp. OR-4]MDT7834231.1 response regulator transcription factor [Aquabacterium sp. OR-4]
MHRPATTISPAAPRRCLLVDDDPVIRTELAAYLPRFGLQLDTVAHGQAMRMALAAAPVQALLLDLMLPGEDGLSLCRWLRRQAPPLQNLPVLMLTAQGDATSRVLGLELGADDYLPKPFEPRELVARLQALLRRAHGQLGQGGLQQATHVAVGGWLFDRLNRTLRTPQGLSLALSAAESRLFTAFVAHPRLLLTRDRLLQLTRSEAGDAGDSRDAAEPRLRAVDLAVSRLRAKLEAGAQAAPMILTLRGQGYLLDADITRA